MQIKLTAVFKKAPSGYIGFVPELPGANTQGATLEEARTNLQEAVMLVMEANRTLTVYVNRAAKKASTVPRHREIDEFLVRKILDIPQP